jgi:hypothetical protein
VLGIDNRISGSGRKISARFLNNWGSRSGKPIQVIGDERKPTVKRDGIVKAFSTGVVLSWGATCTFSQLLTIWTGGLSPISVLLSK